MVVVNVKIKNPYCLKKNKKMVKINQNEKTTRKKTQYNKEEEIYKKVNKTPIETIF